MIEPAAQGQRIKEAAMAHFGRSSTSRSFENATDADGHGFVLIEQDGTFVVPDWRVKHDGEIGFSDERVWSERSARQDYRRRLEYSRRLVHNELVGLEPDEEAQPLETDVESALEALVDISGSRWWITLSDAQGQEIASIAGAMVPPEAFEQEGVKLARFGVSREGMEATVRFPIEPNSRCVIEPAGGVSGKLSNGSSWVAVPLR